jgi:outer membrane protein assembly factor BamC
MYRLLVIFAALLATGCSIPSLDRVLSDERTDYKKSETLPPLDVPPDLSANEPNTAMTIPGETATATYKDFKNQNQPQQTQTPQPAESAPRQQANPAVVAALPATTAAPAASGAGPFVAVRGTRQDIWARLRAFLTAKGYQLDLDDYELGYMETLWSAPQAENGLTFRNKYKIYAEPGGEADIILLYIDNVRQEQAIQGNGNAIWLERGNDSAAERLLAGEMNMYFNGGQQASAVQPAPVAAADSAAPRTAPAPAPAHTAQIQDIGDGKILLAIPDEYTLAWRRTGQALRRAGLIVKGEDQEQGLYQIAYQGTPQEQGGWTSRLKKLKFWGKDQVQETAYSVALTGVADRTELVLLNANGDWEDTETAERILTMILAQYNNLQ